MFDKVKKFFFGENQEAHSHPDTYNGPMGQYKIIGEVVYTDEDGENPGVLELNSVQTLPTILGDEWVALGLAEVVVITPPEGSNDSQELTPEEIAADEALCEDLRSKVIAKVKHPSKQRLALAILDCVSEEELTEEFGKYRVEEMKRIIQNISGNPYSCKTCAR